MTTSLMSNEKINKTLAAWSQGGRFPHAILLEGSSGSGRSHLAGEIARILLCSGEQPPCGSCPACHKTAKGIHPDLHLFQGEGGARSFHISQVRLIREEAWISPNDGDRKVFLLKEAQELSVQAQNALLKLMEEPPKGVFFLLTCENSNQLLPTIRSRVALLSLQLPTPAEAATELARRLPGRSSQEYLKATTETAGNIGQALALLAGDSPSSSYQIATELWGKITKGDHLGAGVVLAGYERNKEGFLELLTQLHRVITQQLLARAPQKTGQPTPLQCSQILAIIEELEQALAGNLNLLLGVTVLSAKIGQVFSSN